MRAEAQAHIDQINDALALLRRFLNWDQALRRLDELNARVEDQALWSDPKAAQAVMRERRRLDEAITATRTIERELSDTAELIEMADAEGDAAMAEEGIDITTEQPKILTTEAVQDSDVVITMGCGDTCPIYPGKRYEDWQLDDPAGQGIDAVRPIRDDIKARIQTLLSELVPAGA